MKTGTDRVDAVVVDEEAVGSVDKIGLGAKILRGDRALEYFLQEKSSDKTVSFNFHIIRYPA